MTNEDLLKLKKEIEEFSEEEKKERDVYLRGLATGEIYGPLLEYPSINRVHLKHYSKEDVRKIYPKKGIYTAVKELCERNPNITMTNYYGFKKKARKFLRTIDTVADALWANNIREGDRVTICSPTTPETFILNQALIKIGAIAHNIDPRDNASRIGNAISNVDAKLVFYLDLAYPKIDRIIRQTSAKKAINISLSDFIPFYAKPIFKKKLQEKLDKKGIKIPDIKNDDFYMNWHDFVKTGKYCRAIEAPYRPNRIVAMVMTGGTTGLPKTVSLSNDACMSIVYDYMATDLGLSKGQNLLNIMPEFIAYGYTFGIIMAAILGIENIIIPQFDINEFPDDIIKYRPNHIVGVPTHCTSLMHSEKMDHVDLGSFLKSISAGGDKFHENDEKEFNEWLHKHGFKNNVIVGYGLTERNSSIATRLNKCNVTGSAGIPLLSNDIAAFRYKIDSNTGNMIATDEELGYNEEGEICVRGNSSMIGYYHDNEKTKEIQKIHSDGTLWTHTKDCGYIDQDGNVFIKARMKNMIIRPDGHNVWPLAMENVILTHPDVLECCVVGLPSRNDTQGEYPTAVIVLKDSTKKSFEEVEKELRELCLEALPERDVPMYYSKREESLPLTGVGKIDSLKIKEEEQEKVKKLSL